ncbi:hypothetical protein, partial [Pseudomonas aeruginosa]|uniref:hypothetical protein n=1 Tax=Pseudomonas aeruginosa TaxID=287 RepID=UPI0019695E5C
LFEPDDLQAYLEQFPVRSAASWRGGTSEALPAAMHKGKASAFKARLSNEQVLMAEPEGLRIAPAKLLMNFTRLTDASSHW